MKSVNSALHRCDDRWRLGTRSARQNTSHPNASSSRCRPDNRNCSGVVGQVICHCAVLCRAGDLVTAAVVIMESNVKRIGSSEWRQLGVELKSNFNCAATKWWASTDARGHNRSRARGTLPGRYDPALVSSRATIRWTLPNRAEARLCNALAAEISRSPADR